MLTSQMTEPMTKEVPAQTSYSIARLASRHSLSFSKLDSGVVFELMS